MSEGHYTGELDDPGVKCVREVECQRCMMLGYDEVCDWCGGSGVDYETTVLVRQTGLLELHMDQEEKDQACG
jgi:hypothetical protein